MARKSKASAPDLFIEGDGQLRLIDKSVEQKVIEDTRVECLGLHFASEDERREHFLDLLRKKLADLEFRQTPGFPIAGDDDIIRMSDAPWYTACPNPFLNDFTKAYGSPYDAKTTYERDPFAVDTSVGKTDALYKAHGYHTKVPHLAIVPSILHYTDPGDIVLDGFAGSGMTGVASQFCGAASQSYRKELENAWTSQGLPKPKWGARRAILNDLGPAASFIAANYTTPVDVKAFERAAKRVLRDVQRELGWMYEVIHDDGKTICRMNYTVWSEVFSCPNCASEVNFVKVAYDKQTKKVMESFACPACSAELTRRSLEQLYVTEMDPVSLKPRKTPKREPVLINYSVGREKFEREPTRADLELIKRISETSFPREVPTTPLPYMHMTHERAKMDSAGVTCIHHFFLPRAARSLASLWRRAHAELDSRTRQFLVFFIEQAIWGMSILNRYSPSHFSQVNRALNGVYYVASQTSEVSPWYILEGKLERLVAAFGDYKIRPAFVATSTGSCAHLNVPDSSIDYIFTDPPFGENIYYSDMNFLVESWHRVQTAAETEAIVDRAKDKTVLEYQGIMRRCFSEYARVLKPGRWMTVVFSNSSNAVWRAIQEALGTAGFVVADVRMLDKQQGSYRQVTSSAVKQDLVMSAYKPAEAISLHFSLGASSSDGAWAFVAEHLKHLPQFLGANGQAEIIAERTAQVLHDRMVAFHVQRHLLVPMSTADFMTGLEQKFIERDGMYFLPNQAAEYEQKRMSTSELRQLELFVVDEASAIQWLKRELSAKPRGLQDLTPAYLKEVQNWARHERPIELRDLLKQNFLHYDGQGPVPNQIHGYLSSNFKECRSLPKDSPVLVEKARDRWYVPDVKKQGDIDKIRVRALLAEFETYKSARDRKLATFRTEAVKAGFADCYEKNDYKSIVAVAGKLPETLVQEDPDLLMYFDVANARLGP